MKYSNGNVTKPNIWLAAQYQMPHLILLGQIMLCIIGREYYTITQDLVITEQFADRYYTITWQGYNNLIRRMSQYLFISSPL